MSNQSWVLPKVSAHIMRHTACTRMDKFSVILSEVQTRNYNQYETWKYNYQRARR